MGLAAFHDVGLSDAAILGLPCCCKEMFKVTKVNGVISDDADVNLAADILTPQKHFANNSPLNSSHRWLLASPFFGMGKLSHSGWAAQPHTTVCLGQGIASVLRLASSCLQLGSCGRGGAVLRSAWEYVLGPLW